jgi:hypothetical protein
MSIFQHISGRNALFCRQTGKILITLLVISALVSSLNGEKSAPGYPDTLQAVLEENDSFYIYAPDLESRMARIKDLISLNYPGTPHQSFLGQRGVNREICTASLSFVILTFIYDLPARLPGSDTLTFTYARTGGPGGAA